MVYIQIQVITSTKMSTNKTWVPKQERNIGYGNMGWYDNLRHSEKENTGQ